MLKKIFSVTNEYLKNKKRKVFTIAGIKIKIKCFEYSLLGYMKYSHLLNMKVSDNIEFPKFSRIDVSIIIPVYNQYEYTIRCLNSIFQNTHNINYEVIVIDDCSTDCTKNIPRNVKNIKYILNEENKGFVKSCNIGASFAEGEYLYFLNNDTFVLKNCIKNLVDTFKNVSNAGIVGSKIINPNNFLIQSCGAEIDEEGYSKALEYNSSPLKKTVNKINEVMYVCGASLMIKKIIWDRLDGFDEIYSPGYYEESDLCVRCYQAGYKVIYQPKAEIFHYGNVTFGKDVGLNKYWTRNRKIFIEKYSKCLNKFKELTR